MPKRAISITLADDNLTWLRGRTRALKVRSVSETLDRLVTEARTSGRTTAAASRSVVGSVDIAAHDPDLAGADAVIRDLFETSFERPVVVRERGPAYSARKAPRPRRG
jgi:hypothetical protein